ncbi:MAG: hypothetical protein AAF411_01240 [Myxococcota bacterium]
MKVSRTLIALLTLGLAAACGGEEPVEETPTEEAANTEATEETEAPEAEAEEAQAEVAEEIDDEALAEAIPIAEDFEDEVAEAISEDNYEAMLAELEAELGPDE